MNENEIIAQLNVTGLNFEPQEFSARVKLQPTKTWHVGEPIGKSIRKYERNGWSVASGKVAEVEDALAELISKIESSLGELKRAIYGCDVELSLVIYSRAYVPSISIASDQIQKLAELRARVDIDFYDLVEKSNES